MYIVVRGTSSSPAAVQGACHTAKVEPNQSSADNAVAASAQLMCWPPQFDFKNNTAHCHHRWFDAGLPVAADYRKRPMAHCCAHFLLVRLRIYYYPLFAQNNMTHLGRNGARTHARRARLQTAATPTARSLALLPLAASACPRQHEQHPQQCQTLPRHSTGTANLSLHQDRLSASDEPLCEPHQAHHGKSWHAAILHLPQQDCGCRR